MLLLKARYCEENYFVVLSSAGTSHLAHKLDLYQCKRVDFDQ
jgi:hypothetical protein